jgi:hypothetical protein
MTLWDCQGLLQQYVELSGTIRNAWKDTNDWMNIANEFYQRMLCMGNTWITIPSGNGSLFIITIILSQLYLGLVEKQLPIYCTRCWSSWKSSDSHGFKNSNPERKLELNQLGGSRLLPSDDNGKCMPFVIVGVEPSTLLECALWPHLNRNISIQQWIYSYRLTRACWMVGYAFGIMAN